ncbi:DUF1080 domain-containing protein [Bacteroidia bacterium]|nr:DUF1080 domain-containing protein [Bacteroidia bacterium]
MMRFLLFICTIGVFLFSRGQNVTQNYSDTLYFENFENNTIDLFPQKFNAFELSIVEDGYYRVKRMDTEGRSMVYLKHPNDLSNYEIDVKYMLTKSSSASVGGIIFHGQSNPSRAIIVEINSDRQYRVLKITNNQERYILGDPENLGWLKHSAIEKNGENTITIKTQSEHSDIYMNGTFVNSIYDMQLTKGKIGLFSGPESEIKFNQFLLKNSSNLTDFSNRSSSSGIQKEEPNIEFQEVILIFKTKIDKQQQTIASLQREVDKYRSMLNYDTTLIAKASELEIQNTFLTYQLDSTTQLLQKNTSRLLYLESLKEDIEKGSNGDLVLNLTQILANLKKENAAIKKEKSIHEQENKKLKEDVKILLREIDRLKNSLPIPE